MSFTVEDFHDLVRLVTERPEWRADLRRLVLTDELLSLSEQLAKFQLRVEDRFAMLVERIAALEERTEKRFQELTERLTLLEERTEKRFQELTERIATLEERTEKRFQELTERLTLLEERTEARFQVVEGQIASLTVQVNALTVQVSALTKTVESLVVDVGELKGESLENRYRTRASAYFSRLMRRIHVLDLEELASLLDEGIDTGALSERQAEDILLADLVVRGKSRDDGSEIYLVVEVSWGVGPHDVERAVRRSELLAKAGLSTVPVVAGRQITKEARQLAQGLHVRQITDGQTISLE